jgi:hypothetical protein
MTATEARRGLILLPNKCLPRVMTATEARRGLIPRVCYPSRSAAARHTVTVVTPTIGGPSPPPIPDLPGIGGPPPSPSPICRGSGVHPHPRAHPRFASAGDRGRDHPHPGPRFSSGVPSRCPDPGRGESARESKSHRRRRHHSHQRPATVPASSRQGSLTSLSDAWPR